MTELWCPLWPYIAWGTIFMQESDYPWSFQSISIPHTLIKKCHKGAIKGCPSWFSFRGQTNKQIFSKTINPMFTIYLKMFRGINNFLKKTPRTRQAKYQMPTYFFIRRHKKLLIVVGICGGQYMDLYKVYTAKLLEFKVRKSSMKTIDMPFIF